MLSRRSVLAGLLGAAACGSASAAAEAGLAFSDLYAADAVLSDKCLALSGRTVEMDGYMAPPLKAEASFFVLTSMPMAVCPFCETEAQWPDDIVLVLTDGPTGSVPFNRAIRVRGILETGFEKDPETGFVSLIRLRHAEFERL